MTRKQVLDALTGAGASNDSQTWTRIYVENRVSLVVARECWQKGRRFAAFVAERDAKEQRA